MKDIYEEAERRLEEYLGDLKYRLNEPEVIIEYSVFPADCI
jgi:hypothetical protein